MDSVRSTLSRLSLGDTATPPGTTDTKRPVTSDTDIFEFDKFVEDALDSGIHIIDPDDVERGKHLGSGSTMSVFEGKWKSEAKAVALKYINFTPSVGASGAGRNSEFQNILRSAALELRVLRHEAARIHANIVDILALSWQEHISPTGLTRIFPIFVMELACPEHHTLMEKMSSVPALSVKLSLLQDVFEGLSALHGLGVVHGDLKPENVLVFRDDDGKITAKLSDFAFSHADKHTLGRMDAYAGGTEYWNAPECLDNAPCDLIPFRNEGYRDIYSYGLIGVFVLLGELPFAQQHLTLPQISSMKLEDRVSLLFASRWRFTPSGLAAPESAQWQDLTGPDLEVIQQQPLRWQVRQGGRWCTGGDLPPSVLRLIPKMLQLQPLKRPKLEVIRNAFKSCTGERVMETQLPSVNDKASNKYSGYINVTGTRRARVNGICDPEIPPALRVALFRSISAVARGTKGAKRTNAMLNMGYFKMNAFGTLLDTQGAMFWFGRAAMEGDRIAQEMVFRFEKLLNESATELVLGLDRRLRANWMVICLLHNVGSSRLRDILPEQIRLDSPLDRLKSVLLGLEPEMVEKGLRRAVDDSVIRLPAMQKRDYSQDPTWTTLPDLWTAITQDDTTLLKRVIKPNDPRWCRSLKKTVIFATVEERSADILRSLVYDYKFEMDETFQYGMARSFLRSDTEMVGLFLDLGCPWKVLIGSTAINMSITGCSVAAIELALGFYDQIKITSGANECPSYWSMDIIRRQLMDGIQPMMCYSDPHINPIDNNPPPIFVATAHNRPINLSLILSLGGNPNVRYMGTTALHLAVKLLRPLLVGVLLAFGADPNARDFKSGCETPLHQLSGENLRVLHADDEYFDYCDVFGHPFVSIEDPNEHDHHRKLIIRLLLEYGADIGALCDSQLTPLGMAVLSTAPHASAVVKHLVEAGADPSNAGVAGLSALHAASGKGRLQDLRQLLSLTSLAGLEQKSHNSLTPLMTTCMYEDRDRYAFELLDAGANIAARNCAGLNALSMATRHGRKGIFNLLIDRLKFFCTSLRDQILVDNPTGGGRTAAHDALDSDDQTMVPYFLQELVPLMCNFHKPTKAGVTPLHLAVMKKNLPALKVIMANNPDVNARTHGGVTALHLAYGLQESVLVDYLISWNADPELRNDDHMTPYAFGSICRRDPGALDKYFAGIRRIDTAGLGKDAFGPVHDLKVLAAELVKRNQYVPDDRFTRDASDPSQGITKVEEVHLVMFESSLTKNGERHYDTLWKMNNLGCVYERYGRLSMAEGLYRKGWNIARDVLGNGHILTADFANKLGRVQEDIGCDRIDADLSAWTARFKKDTLNRPLAEYRFPKDEKELISLSSPPQEVMEGACDQAHCKNPATITCPVCLVFRYCSESCKTADWVGDKASHGRECMRSTSVDENPAIISRTLRRTDPYARFLTGHMFSQLTGIFIDSDFGNHLPTVRSAQLILYNPKTFHQPLKLGIKSSSAILLLSNGGFKYMIKATDSQWRAPKGLEMIVPSNRVDLWVVPDPSTRERASVNTPSVTDMYATEGHDQMLLLVEYIHVDFAEAMERRTQRLTAEERNSLGQR